MNKIWKKILSQLEHVSIHIFISQFRTCRMHLIFFCFGCNFKLSQGFISYSFHYHNQLHSRIVCRLVVPFGQWLPLPNRRQPPGIFCILHFNYFLWFCICHRNINWGYDARFQTADGRQSMPMDNGYFERVFHSLFIIQQPLADDSANFPRIENILYDFFWWSPIRSSLTCSKLQPSKCP